MTPQTPPEKDDTTTAQIQDRDISSTASDDNDADAAATDKATTRRLLLKLDSRILPIFILLVLCSFLDRTNVGNAKLYHLEADLGMTNKQYIMGLAAFYPLYIAA